MSLETFIHNQLMVAQSIFALADHIEGGTGYAFAPVPFASLPTPPAAGMVSCVFDSTVTTPGAVIVGGGTNTVLAFYNGTNWVVVV